MSTCLILQRRATKTGAQTSLLRSLKSGAWTQLHPRVIVGETGWLTSALDDAALPWTQLKFPSARSVGARLHGNRRFAAAVLGRVNRPRLVVGNDHPEGLLSQAVAHQAGCPWAVLLRSHGASSRDLRKHGCHKADAVFSVDDVSRAAEALGRKVAAFPEGLLADEFHPAKAPQAGLGPRVLVVGTPSPGKGWADFVAALHIAAEAVGFPKLQWDFTGPTEGLASPPAGHRFENVGRAEDYAALVRKYDLVVHPSRGETFGLAVVEAWAAGIPVLSSNTGVVPRLSVPDALRFAANDVASLSQRFIRLSQDAPIDVAQIIAVQDDLRRHHQWPDNLAPVMRDLWALIERDTP